MLLPVPNEPIVESNGQRWEYVYDTNEKTRGYLHLNCDAMTCRNGYCLMCGKPCPTIWTMPETRNFKK